MGEVFHLRRPAGSIIGREGDIRAVRDAIDTGRLVTLIGPGGVGKTALAAEVIHEIEPEFDRVVTVELADAIEPSDVVRRVASAVLGETSDDLARVADGLAAVPTLLAIDNCEHLVDATSELVVSLLAAAEQLRIIATSRRALAVADEYLWTVEPLATTGLPDLTNAPAVQLFLERVRQVVPTFELTAANRADVKAISRAADGVPLVIELAAALVRVRPLREILDSMSIPARELGGERRDGAAHQRTLADSLEWSRRFLSDEDARLLDRLSVFVGGFTSAAAGWLDDSASTGLSRLVDHSLLRFDPITSRYRLLEVVRLDAFERLKADESSDYIAAMDRHLAWCRSIVEQIAQGRFEPDPDDVYRRFEDEVPNLIAALRRAQQAGDVESYRALLGPVAVWWVHYQQPDDPADWESAFPDGDVPLQWHANVMSALAFYWSHQGDHERALMYARRATVLHDEVGDLAGRSLAELVEGNAESSRGNVAEAMTAYSTAIETGIESGFEYPELAARLSLARLQPDAPGTGDQLTRGLRIAEDGFPSLVGVVGAELGMVALREGKTAQARRLTADAVKAARAIGFREGLATALCSQGEVALADGDSGLAKALLDEALSVARSAGHVGLIERATIGLGSVAQMPDGPRATSVGELLEPLSDRELSVARLLRGSLTQREIAEELYIAPSTVKTHIKSIYRKLGVNKRSYAITRALELGLFERG